ncbi:MAG: DUF1292 domain-containing protein [Lachnospiraceae bacterium]|nr:DUF1292 domain-containing protein [Lachnospiraceae bacterium]MBR4816885.1 DUF1292 domain-containing protein [Lachnospiraceae bacterium]
MDEKKESRSIKFTTDEGVELDLFVVADTKLNGKNYLLVTDTEDSDEANAYILKELASDSKEVAYDLVDDDKELLAVGEVFNELLDDVDIVEE